MTGAAPDEAIGEAEAACLFAPMAGQAAILLAVSGGADSTGLLLLAARWAAGRPVRLHAATVDHGLRPAAAAEAVGVARLAGRLGVPHAILRWTGRKPATGIEAAARAARYALLDGHAGEIGATCLVTAHTRDDQAETVLMRLAAGSGPAGLAAMRPAAVRGGMLHLRPLLDVPKARLVATLRAAGAGWSEDESNAQARFARPRLRAARAVLAREGLTDARLARFARRAARAEDALAAAGADAWRRAASEAEREILLDAAVMAGVPEEIALRLLRAAIERVGSGVVRLDRLEALAAALRGPEGNRKRTLAGAAVRRLADGGIQVSPAPPRRIR